MSSGQWDGRENRPSARCRRPHLKLQGQGGDKHRKKKATIKQQDDGGNLAARTDAPLDAGEAAKGQGPRLGQVAHDEGRAHSLHPLPHAILDGGGEKGLGRAALATRHPLGRGLGHDGLGKEVRLLKSDGHHDEGQGLAQIQDVDVDARNASQHKGNDEGKGSVEQDRKA